MTRNRTTRIDLADSIRKKIIKLLNENLVDAIHMSIQAKQAHWNVKGPHFLQLHELFDKLYERAGEWSDLLAERAVQLGGVAEANLEAVSRRTRLSPYSLDLIDGFKHVDALANSLVLFGRAIRKAIDDSAKIGDMGSADLFTEISRDSDKFLWLLEAHLVAKPRL